MPKSKPIEWNFSRMQKFRSNYNTALEEEQSTFYFLDHKIDIGYARYLLEYLEDKFKDQKE